MRTEEEIRAEQRENHSQILKIIAEEEVRIYPAYLSGAAYAPSAKHSGIRFTVEIVGDALDGNLSQLGEWHKAIVFYKPRALNEEKVKDGET